MKINYEPMDLPYKGPPWWKYWWYRLTGQYKIYYTVHSKGTWEHGKFSASMGLIEDFHHACVEFGRALEARDTTSAHLVAEEVAYPPVPGRKLKRMVEGRSWIVVSAMAGNAVELTFKDEEE